MSENSQHGRQNAQVCKLQREKGTHIPGQTAQKGLEANHCLNIIEENEFNIYSSSKRSDVEINYPHIPGFWGIL